MANAERAANVPYSGELPAPSGAIAQDGSGAQPYRLDATPESFGAPIARGLSEVGKTTEALANHYNEMATHTAVNDAYVNGYAPQANAIISNFKKLSGTEAIQQQPIAEQQIRDLNKQYLGQGSMMQQEFMGQLIRSHTLYSMNDISNHADRAFTEHEQIVNTQSIKNASDEAANNWQDPDRVDLNVNRAMGLSKINYSRKVGTDPQSQDVANQLAKEDASHVAMSAIQMSLDSRNPQMANFYKNKYSDILSGKDKLTAEKAVSSLTIENNASHTADNLLTGQTAVPQGTAHYQSIQTKADVATLAQKEGLDPNVAFALHGTESDYGRGIKPGSRLKDDFQTDPKYRDTGYADDSLQSSVHNAAKIWNANNAELNSQLGRAPTTAEGYVAYNQGGAGAGALLKAAPTDTAIHALSTIMPSDEAKEHVLKNGGTATMSAQDFSQHLQDIFQNHYDTQKTTATDNLPEVIRNQANTQLPAMQQTSNPHQFFQQLNDKLPAAQAYADSLPDDKARETLQKQLKLKYEEAKLADNSWKVGQAKIANQYGEDPRYTSLDQVPTTVKNDLQEAGQLKALERQFTDKLNPKKDNTYGDGFLRVMGRLASDDPTDKISDLAGLQEAYADTKDLHSSGFKALQAMVKNTDSAGSGAVVSQQYQFLSDLQHKMVAGEQDTQGKKAFEAALPQFFTAYNKATSGNGNLADVFSLDPNNKNSFVSTMKLPTSAEMTSKKIQNTTSWLSSFFGGSGGGGNPSVHFTAQEQVMADFADGRITKQEKDRRLGVATSSSQVPGPE